MKKKVLSVGDLHLSCNKLDDFRELGKSAFILGYMIITSTKTNLLTKLKLSKTP